ncbi:MAG: DUF1735 domain-containing protein [Parafilimonas sp.]|nr:DUF1735 domain-containing protein [Parafilimonas sp.]
MKKIAIHFSSIILLGSLFTSCVKDRNVGPDFSSTQPVLELRTPISNKAGLANFSKAVIGNLPDTVQFYVNLASNNTLDHDLNITIGVDQDRLNTYNADAANAVKYELLPDSDYTILKTSGTIVKGQRIDSFQVVFYKDKIDITSNYMLPVAITDGDGVLISENQGVIWFHAIGNPIAGLYEEEWIRWNQTDTTLAPDYDLDLGAVGFAPDNPTQISVQSLGTGEVDIISFTNNAGVLSNFQVSFDENQFATLGITLTGGPYLLTADPVNGVYVVYFTYNNSTGSPRCIKNIYRKL